VRTENNTTANVRYKLSPSDKIG